MYKRVSRWIQIRYAIRKGSYFIWQGKRYYLSDVIRTHNNPYGEIDCSDYIHGYVHYTYWNPVFVEINDTGEAVRIYRRENKNG